MYNRNTINNVFRYLKCIAKESGFRSEASGRQVLQVQRFRGAFSVFHQPARSQLPFQIAARRLRHCPVDVRAERGRRVHPSRLLRKEKPYGVTYITTNVRWICTLCAIPKKRDIDRIVSITIVLPCSKRLSSITKSRAFSLN